MRGAPWDLLVFPLDTELEVMGLSPEDASLLVALGSRLYHPTLILLGMTTG